MRRIVSAASGAEKSHVRRLLRKTRVMPNPKQERVDSKAGRALRKREVFHPV